MAKTILRACDLCGANDGTTREDGSTVTVRNTTIVGAAKDAGRKDLCDADRLRILAAAGYTETEAAAIVTEHDKEKTRKKATDAAPDADAAAAPDAKADDSPPAPEADAAPKNGAKAKVPAGAK